MCASLLIQKITRSSNRPNNHHNFEIVMNINGLLKYWQQLKCEVKISSICVGDKVTGTASKAMVC